MVREQYLLDTFNNLPEKAKLLIIKNNKFDFLEDLQVNIEYCRSPIEIIFATAFEIYNQKSEKYIFMDLQAEIENGKYIADFIIEYDELLNPYFKKDFSLIIECDGYNFHQKTKKQVEYDNKREYDLKMLGYQILRFSGSEIYNDPEECIERLFNYIEEKAYDK